MAPQQNKTLQELAKTIGQYSSENPDPEIARRIRAELADVSIDDKNKLSLFLNPNQPPTSQEGSVSNDNLIVGESQQSTALAVIESELSEPVKTGSEVVVDADDSGGSEDASFVQDKFSDIKKRIASQRNAEVGVDGSRGIDQLADKTDLEAHNTYIEQYKRKKGLMGKSVPDDQSTLSSVADDGVDTVSRASLSDKSITPEFEFDDVARADSAKPVDAGSIVEKPTEPTAPINNRAENRLAAETVAGEKFVDKSNPELATEDSVTARLDKWFESLNTKDANSQYYARMSPN